MAEYDSNSLAKPASWRGFRTLWFGQSVSLLGDGIFNVAIPFAVLSVSPHEWAIGLAIGAAMLPLAISLLVGGLLADRFRRKRIVATAEGIRAILQLATGLLLVTDTAKLWHVIAIAVLYGVASGIFRPALIGFVPELIEKPDRLPAANGMLQASRGITLIVGASLGGVLVAWHGPGTAILVDAATFAVSCIATLLLAPVVRTATKTSTGGLREAASFAIRSGWIWKMVLTASTSMLIFIGPLQVVGPLVAKSSYDGSTSWGLITSALAVGVVVGSIAIVRGLSRPIPIGTVLWMGTITTPLLLAYHAPLSLVLISQVAQGAGLGIYTSVWTAAIQQSVPADMVSRMSAIDSFGSVLGMPVGAVAAGVLASWVGTHNVLVGMAICSAALTVCLAASRDLQRIGRIAP